MFASRNATPKFTLEVKSDNAGTSGTDQFTIPVGAGTFLYDYTTSDGQSDTGLTGATTITFASGVGTYEIYITGTFPLIFFNNGGDRLKLLRVLEWGDYAAGGVAQGSAFFGCNNLTSIASDVDNINLITDGSNMFQGCGALATLPSGMTLPLLTNGGLMFYQCSSLSALPSGMTLPLLTNGFAMFYLIGLTDLPSGMTLSSLTAGTSMFLNNTINTTRYSQLLVDLENLNPNNSIVFHGGSSLYNATGETARNLLTGVGRTWTITDGGLEP